MSVANAIYEQMNINRIHNSHPAYPAGLQKYLGDYAPERLSAIGDFDIFKNKKFAFFCSVKCPGNIILQAYDFAQLLRDTGVTVVSGFHSPMEREVLNILLRPVESLSFDLEALDRQVEREGNPIIVCPARSIEGMRIRKEYKEPLANNRLLFLSPFDKKHHRVTAETSSVRNEFVAALVDEVFVAYAAPGGRTEQFSKDILAKGKPLFTFKSDDNRRLIELGAKPMQLTDLKSLHRRAKEQNSIRDGRMGLII